MMSKDVKNCHILSVFHSPDEVVSLAGPDVGLDPLEVADGQVVGGVRVALVRRQPKVLHRLHLQRGDMRFD